MSNPFAGRKINSDWQAHLDRGSLGGIDYDMPVGTPLPAPSDGTLTNVPNNGSGGHTAIITRKDGTKTVYFHLSKFTTPREVKEGEIVGYSGGAKGAAGSGNSSGPHLHAHDVTVDGKRAMPFSTIGGNEPQTNPLLNPIALFIRPVAWLTDPGNWVRIGFFTLGTTLLLIAAIMLFARSEVGKEVVSSVKSTAGTAVKAGTMAVTKKPV